MIKNFCLHIPIFSGRHYALKQVLSLKKHPESEMKKCIFIFFYVKRCKNKCFSSSMQTKNKNNFFINLFFVSPHPLLLSGYT